MHCAQCVVPDVPLRTACRGADPNSQGEFTLHDALMRTALCDVLIRTECRGADPNSQGEFKRTPLWRAAFLGKQEVIMPLLEAGADPRIGGHGCKDGCEYGCEYGCEDGCEYECEAQGHETMSCAWQGGGDQATAGGGGGPLTGGWVNLVVAAGNSDR